ncbi:MAG: DUF1403 family protein [Rhodobacteraceae bacterium]|nr:DUF1403 family protein [Paracoccaceae bacterium]
MIHAPRHDAASDPRPFRLPGWLSRKAPETLEEGAFFSGAALAMLDLAQAQPAMPHALLRARLALMAAAHGVALAGRREGEAALRDILCLLRAGEQAGPSGDIALAWCRATARPLSDAGLKRALPGQCARQIDLLGKAAHGAAVTQAAQVIEAILRDAPREHVTALILADAALARAMGWAYLIPLLGIGLPRRDLRLRGGDLRLACHGAVVRSVGVALPLAAELTRRAAQLHAIAPKLRSKQAAQAVDLFLTRDAIAAAALTPLMSDRAARRFCDRLVTLGAVRELTGRDTFRLYGV